MDVHFFRELLREGLKTVYLGGSEQQGVAHFCSKLLPYKPGYVVRAVLYRPTPATTVSTVVRPATEYDITPLADLYRSVYNAMDALGERWTKPAARKFISHFYRRQPDLFFVAEVDGKIVGATVAGIQPWWDGNHLVEGEIFIDPACSDKTVEKKLLKRLLLTARNTYKVVAWDTLMPIVGEHTFGEYKAIGFSEMPHVKAISADMNTMLARLED